MEWRRTRSLDWSGKLGSFKYRNIIPGEGYCHQHGRPPNQANPKIKWANDQSCYYYRQDGNGTGQASAGPQPTGLCWKGGVHPEGTSGMCTKHSCLNVAVHRDGWKKIPDVMAGLDTAFATDSLDAF